MAADHGGARPGAGRPTGSRTKPKATPTGRTYADALEYLEAVVRGDEPPDGQRIAAARIVLPFQKPKARAPVESPAPRALRAKTERDLDAAVEGEWKAKAAKVRERLAKPKKGNP